MSGSHRTRTSAAGMGADIHCTRAGYTLTLLRMDGAFPVLAADGRRPLRWHRLDEVLAYLGENFGVLSAIHLNLHE